MKVEKKTKKRKADDSDDEEDEDYGAKASSVSLSCIAVGNLL